MRVLTADKSRAARCLCRAAWALEPRALGAAACGSTDVCAVARERWERPPRCTTLLFVLRGMLAPLATLLLAVALSVRV